MDPITQRGESRLRTLIAPFDGGRARLAAHVVLATMLLAAAGVGARLLAFRMDVGALVIVYVALEYSLLRGAIAAGVLAYIADLFSGESRCLTMASLAIVFVVMRLMVVRVTGARWLTITAVSVFATIVDLTLKLALETLVGPGVTTFAAMAPSLPAILGGAAVFGYPCYRLFFLVDDRFRPREESIVYGTLVPRRWM